MSVLCGSVLSRWMPSHTGAAFLFLQTAGCFACDHFSTDLGPSVPGANHSTVVVRPVPV